MASGPYFDKRRGTYSAQWFNGTKWCRSKVADRRPGWKPSDGEPKKVPPEAMAGLVKYTKEEQRCRERKSPADLQSVAAFLDTYRTVYATAMQPGSLKELDNVIRVFLAWCEANKIIRLTQVDSKVCYRWVSDRACTISPRSGKPIQYSTLKKERAMLAAAWSQAAHREEIERNPWKSAQVPGKPVTKKRGSWTTEEYQKLIASCRPWLRDFLIFGCNTGLRVEAIRGIEWRDIEWATGGSKGFGWVVVRPELDKIHKGYRVPISATLHDMLARRLIHRDAHVKHVITGHCRGPIGSNNISDRAIRKACEKIGMKIPDSPNHHCRRTFGRWAVHGQLTGKPVPLYIVSQWLGHMSISTTMRYLALSEDDSTRFMIGDDSDTPAP